MLQHTIICDDNVTALSSIAENTFHSCITDPPYGISYQNNRLNSALLSELDETDLFSEILSKKLSVYPNPITGISQINVNINKNKSGMIKIYDIQGKIIHQYSLNSGENIINISKIEFQKGIYSVVLYEDGLKSENLKIIVN